MKVSRWVLMGERGGDSSDLPDVRLALEIIVQGTSWAVQAKATGILFPYRVTLPIGASLATMGC